LNESSMSWLMCVSCMLRLDASVECSSEISMSDFSVALPVSVAVQDEGVVAHTGLCRAGPRTA
jgi:hypothetical protein